jgi:hypothetical protein
MKYEMLQTQQKEITSKECTENLSKTDCNYLQIHSQRVFPDKNKNIWVHLTAFNYPRMALHLPEKYRKEAICLSHDSIFRGQNFHSKNIYPNINAVLLTQNVPRH